MPPRRTDALAPGPAHGPPDGPAEWDVAAQTALATRPMLRLPEAAALPHPLDRADRRTADRAPGAGRSGAALLPVAYPATVEGAVAQLAALTRVGLEGGDPQEYRRAYESIMLPGAPAAETARLHRDLRRVRAGVLGFPPTGPVPGLVFTWTPTSALVKGTTDGGRYVVVCVLGELVTGLQRSVDLHRRRVTARRSAGSASGGGSAPAPPRRRPRWPGRARAEAVRAGYRAVR